MILNPKLHRNWEIVKVVASPEMVCGPPDRGASMRRSVWGAESRAGARSDGRSLSLFFTVQLIEATCSKPLIFLFRRTNCVDAWNDEHVVAQLFGRTLSKLELPLLCTQYAQKPRGLGGAGPGQLDKGNLTQLWGDRASRR